MGRRTFLTRLALVSSILVSGSYTIVIALVCVLARHFESSEDLACTSSLRLEYTSAEHRSIGAVSFRIIDLRAIEGSCCRAT